jgi:dimethylargininase
VLAITRPVPRSIEQCELTHLQRTPIDRARAEEQHDAYEDMLRQLGCIVQRLPRTDDLPDSVFIEDTAIVVDECAVITRPGAASRRAETEAVADALRAWRELVYVHAPATIDGGDVLRVGRTFYVGRSSRSNDDGARQLATALAPFGYDVLQADMRECLHLKTAVSTLPDQRLLIDPRCVDARSLGGAQVLHVSPGEEVAANVLVVNDVVVCPAAAPRTRDLLAAEGYRVVTVDASELAKAEGGLTCCCLLLNV